MTEPRYRSPLSLLCRLLLLASMALAGTACGPDAPDGNAAPQTMSPASAVVAQAGGAVNLPVPTPPPTASGCPAPLRLGVLLDKSGSIHQNVVPQLTHDDLDGLIRLVDTCAGGEVAVGVLCNVSGDAPFARLFLAEQKASAPVAERRTADTRDVFTQYRESEAAAEAALLQRQAFEREAKDREAVVVRFRTEAMGLLDVPATCTRTDVIAGANRLLTYLEEPPAPRTVARPTPVGVFISDGADNVRRQVLRTAPDLGALFLLVGGSQDAGVLAPLNPVRFESVNAAIRWLGSASASR